MAEVERAQKTMKAFLQPRYFLSSFTKYQPMHNHKNLLNAPKRRSTSDIKEKTELDRKLQSINFSLNDMGLDDCLSICYHSEEQIQQIVIDNLVMFGVERELITLDCDLVKDIGINRFDLLQLVESVEAYLNFSMLDDDALQCTTVRQIANIMYTILMYDKADQMHRGPYYCQCNCCLWLLWSLIWILADFELYYTFCLKVDELSYVDYLKQLFSTKK